MNRILVPIDFTPASRTASEYAASLAQLFTAQVYLLHVYLEPTPTTEVPSAWIITSDTLQMEYERQINTEITYLQEAYAVDVTGDLVLGYVGDTIKEIATTIDADLIVMGMKKEKPSKILGSATLMVIRKSKVPVLIIPENTVFAPPQQIVYASDFEELTDTSCFNLLLEWMEKFRIDLRLLHVKKEGEAFTSAEVPGRLQMGRLLANYPTYRYDEVVDNDVNHGIQNYMESHPVDLLVMLAHSHNIFERLFGMDHTRPMAYLTNRPLLVLKENEKV